jgi:hypothetical protein
VTATADMAADKPADVADVPGLETALAVAAAAEQAEEPDLSGGKSDTDEDEPDRSGGKSDTEPDEPDRSGGKSDTEPDEPDRSGGKSDTEPDEPDREGGKSDSDADGSKSATDKSGSDSDAATSGSETEEPISEEADEAFKQARKSAKKERKRARKEQRRRDEEEQRQKDEEERKAEEERKQREDEAAQLAALLASSKALKGTGPYSATKSRHKDYKGEETEGMEELEEKFIAPARLFVQAVMTDGNYAQGVGIERTLAADWHRDITPLRKPGGKWEHLTEDALFVRLLKQRLAPVARWLPAHVDQYLSPQGHLRTEKDNKAVVKYLGPEERKNYQLHYKNGGLTQGEGEAPFKTDSMGTNFAGKGFGIFAMSTGGEIYAESHIVGLFHHSSFLAGADVAAAGELKVTGGKLVHVTNKTGHYKADAENLAQALEQFADWGISLDSFQVTLVTAHSQKEDLVTKAEKASAFYRNFKTKPQDGA